MKQLGRRLIAAEKEGLALVKERRQRLILKDWDMGQARTCLVCGDSFLTRKNLRIHRANHRNKTEVICEKTVTT